MSASFSIGATEFVKRGDGEILPLRKDSHLIEESKKPAVQKFLSQLLLVGEEITVPDSKQQSPDDSTAEGAALLVRVNKTLKDKVARAVKKSGLSQKEFLVTALERAVEETIHPTNETLALSQEALTKTHAAEEALRRLTRSLSNSRNR